MLEYLGRLIISVLEKELANVAPEIEKMILEQLTSLVDYLACYLTDKGCDIAPLAKLENKSGD